MVRRILNNKGFTLIELVVVIAILGILAAIAIPRLGKSRISAAITTHNANVRTLESAANMYIADNGIPTGDGTIGKDELKDYLQEWPQIPKGLIGLDLIFEDGTEEGESDSIVDGTSYEATISKDGKTTINPGKIKGIKEEKKE